MEAMDAACARVAARLAEGKAPRGIRWWKNGVCAYWCDFCDKAFSQSGGLKIHARTHTNERPYVCTFPDCDSSFTTSGGLKIHTRTHTNERPYACTFDGCDSTFTQSGGLKIHTRTHTNERPYVCTFPDCEKTFSESGSLVTHTRTHTNERPYVCAFPGCDSSFTQSGALVVHTRTHTKERPYVCTFEGCDSSFTQSGDVVKHMRTHTNERPYSCTFEGCDSRFTASGGLVAHTRTHTNERPYVCAFPGCGYSCAQSRDLITHTRTHTNERPYSCTFEGCDSRFTTSGSLAKHTRTHTGPFCANPDCAVSRRVVVKNEKDVCGFCALGFKFGVKEQIVFEALINHDERFGHFVRDKAMGCGTRRRPDAYADIHIKGDDNALFVIECDEFAHRGNSAECELTRLEEIQAVHGGALYVVRINPDAPDGLSEDVLTLFAERCVEILETDYKNAISADFDDTTDDHIVHHPGRVIEYWGYNPARIERLRAAFLKIQSL
jgi:hypothetical protein